MLSPRDLTHLGAAADALLSPLAGPSPEAWRTGVTTAMRELFGIDHALFVTPEGTRARFHSDTVPSGVLRRFDELTRADAHAGRIRSVDALVDTWFQRRAAGGVEVYNEPLNDRMVDGELHRSTLVNEAVRPGGMYDFLGFMTASPAGELMLFMGHERPGRSRFGAERELPVLRALLPAFRAGHHALVRFGAHRAALATTLDRMTQAVLVLAPDGRAVHRTPALVRLLAADPAREQLEQALAAAGRALAGGAGRAAAPHGAGLADVERRVATAVGRYTVRSARLPAELLGEPGGVLVTIERADTELPQPGTLAERLGLTRREAEVAEALARRLTNAELARALGISPHTAERHTERVLAKLGVRSRHDVAARLRAAADDPIAAPGAVAA
jgi:DNA-binding CsgD family transcriptional regulator